MFQLQIQRTLFSNILKSSVHYESNQFVLDYLLTSNHYEYKEPSVNISACTFFKCNSPPYDDGGALHLSCQNVFIRNSVFIQCISQSTCGAIFIQKASFTYLYRNIFQENIGYYGHGACGLYLTFSAKISKINCSQNKTPGKCSCFSFLSSSDINVTQCIFSQNSCSVSGNIRINSGVLNLSKCKFYSNSSPFIIHGITLGENIFLRNVDNEISIKEKDINTNLCKFNYKINLISIKTIDSRLVISKMDQVNNLHSKNSSFVNNIKIKENNSIVRSNFFKKEASPTYWNQSVLETDKDRITWVILLIVVVLIIAVSKYIYGRKKTFGDEEIFEKFKYDTLETADNFNIKRKRNNKIPKIFNENF